MSSIAVFLVLGGATAFAASELAKNSVGAKQLKKNAVTAAKLKKNAVTASKIAKDAITAEKIKNGAVTGAKVDTATLGTVPSAATAARADSAATFSGYSRRGVVRATAAPALASEAATYAAAPEITLFSVGPFTIYGKCINATTGGIEGTVFIKTSESGAILDSDRDDFEGTPFLDANTPELTRLVGRESISAGQAEYLGVHSPEFTAIAPSGVTVRGDFQIAVKGGNLPGGNGLYGPGDVCLFAGEGTALNG